MEIIHTTITILIIIITKFDLSNQIQEIMKTLLLTSIIIFSFVGFGISQENPDQNPNYKNSMNKYMQMKDTASNMQSVTIHNIYKVVDWAEEKQKRKDLKRTRKHELRKMRIEANKQNRRYRRRRGYNPYYYNDYQDYNYNNPYYNNYGYGNGYSYGLSNDLRVLGNIMYLFNR